MYGEQQEDEDSWLWAMPKSLSNLWRVASCWPQQALETETRDCRGPKKCGTQLGKPVENKKKEARTRNRRKQKVIAESDNGKNFIFRYDKEASIPSRPERTRLAKPPAVLIHIDERKDCTNCSVRQGGGRFLGAA